MLFRSGPTAVVEQYVEVHVDASAPGRIDVPPVTVDNVRLRPADGGEPRFWRADVPTLTGTDPAQRRLSGGFCLDWKTRYDTWTAGDCGQDQGLLRPPPPRPLPAGDAEVVGELENRPTPSAATTPQPTPSAPATRRNPRLLGGLLG